MVIAALPAPCLADYNFVLTCPITTVAGDPNSLYQVSPGQNADVTVAESCTFTCTNEFPTEHEAYLEYSLNVGIQGEQTYQKTFYKDAILGSGAEWQDTESDSLTQALSPGPSGSTDYQAVRTTDINEAKTGDEASNSDPMQVVVQYYA